MRRVLAAAVLMAFLPAAHAQDKGKSEFTHDAEYRLRYDYFQNITGNKSDVKDTNGFDNRFKLDLGMRASEKVSLTSTFLYNANWGGGDNNAIGIYDTTTGGGTKTEQNFMAVNQLFANWMLNEDWSIKAGRMNYQIADGTLMGTNDWEKTPYSFDGVLVNWQAEFGKFQFFGFKYMDAGDVVTTASTTSVSADPEHSAFGINFDLKTMPEWLKVINVHLVKDSSQATFGNGANNTDNVQTKDGQDIWHYGAKAGFAFSMIDLAAWYEGTSGKFHDYDGTGATKTDVTAKGMLMAAEVGVNVPNFVGSRFFFRYHQDSGDKDSTDTTQGTYDGYFTQRHCAAGCMDMLGFGNLTFWTLGWTMKPTDNTEAGLGYWMFSRTEKGTNADGIHTGDFGGGLAGTGTSDKIGSEVDLWATHKYEGNVWTTARLGYFSPDTYLKDNSKKDGITQLMLEAKFAF